MKNDDMFSAVTIVVDDIKDFVDMSRLISSTDVKRAAGVVNITRGLLPEIGWSGVCGRVGQTTVTRLDYYSVVH